MIDSRFARVVALAMLSIGRLATAREPEAAPASTSTAGPLYKTSYRVFDVHAHVPFPSLAALDAQLDVLDRVGVRTFNAVLFEPSGWSYLGGWSEANLLAWLELQKQRPSRVAVFGTVDFNRV